MLPGIDSVLNPFIGILSKGSDVYKVKSEGKPTDLTSGRVELSIPYITIEAVFVEDGKPRHLQARRPIASAGISSVKMNGEEMSGDRVVLSLVKHITGVDLKATIDYKEDNITRELEVYSELVNLLPFKM